MTYDPRCRMYKEKFEWRCRQSERVSQRMPEVLCKIKIMTQRMRTHSVDDPRDLKSWEKYEENVLYAFGHNLPFTLGTPLMTPNSVLYEQLMKRHARSKTLAGMVSRD